MTTISVTSPLTTASLESLLQTLLERFESSKSDLPKAASIPMQVEIRSLDFWRAIVAECLATFFLVFVICGSFVPWNGHSPPYIGIALATGFVVAGLTLCFTHTSGANFNPVVSLALLVTRRISPIKAFLFVTAQGGGAIAGAALLYGVTVSGQQGNLGVTSVSSGLSDWQALGIELCMTFIIVLVYLTTMDSHRRSLSASIGPGPLTYGLIYMACSLVALPSTGASFNPMRSLGPAFVMNKWDAHWVYWLGPIVGGCMAGLLYEFIFNPFRSGRRRKGSVDGDSTGAHSDEEYDEVKSTVQNYHSVRMQHYDQYRPPYSPGGPMNPTSPTGPHPTRLDRAESVYGGTKSLYCKSPPVTRNSLNRSQSVYAKPPPPGNGPVGVAYPTKTLPAAQSTYLSRNVDLIRTESIYATRPANIPVNRTESVYGGARYIRCPEEMHPGARPPPQQQQQQPQQREPTYGTTEQLYSRSTKNHDSQNGQDSLYVTRQEMDPAAGHENYANQRKSQMQSSAFHRQMNPDPTYDSAPQRSPLEVSASSSNQAPLSPADTSKDSAYGSVHGTQGSADWQYKNRQNGQSNARNQPSYPPHVYAQKFRQELASPGSSSHSPGHTPTAFHSPNPVQY